MIAKMRYRKNASLGEQVLYFTSGHHIYWNNVLVYATRGHKLFIYSSIGTLGHLNYVSFSFEEIEAIGKAVAWRDIRSALWLSANQKFLNP